MRLGRNCGFAVLLACVAATARTASAQTPPVTRSDSNAAEAFVRVQLRDTSFIYRSMALERLRTGSTQMRRDAASRFVVALGDTSRLIRSRAMTGLRALGLDATPALPALEA